jgi:hypothetical protein
MDQQKSVSGAKSPRLPYGGSGTVCKLISRIENTVRLNSERPAQDFTPLGLAAARFIRPLTDSFVVEWLIHLALHGYGGQPATDLGNDHEIGPARSARTVEQIAMLEKAADQLSTVPDRTSVQNSPDLWREILSLLPRSG